MFERLPVAGIMTEKAGATGHAAILARSLGIPAVSGLPGLLKDLRTGDLAALDGREGVVHLRPSPRSNPPTANSNESTCTSAIGSLPTASKRGCVRAEGASS